MAKKPESFFDFDPTRFFPQLDPTKMAGEFAKMASQYRLPGVDMNFLVESQRKNLEALAAANRVALEGFQAVINRQMEIVRETLDEAAAALQRAASVAAWRGMSPEAIPRQAELVKAAFEKAVANARELSELVAKSNAEAAETINRRISESLDEIKAMAQKQKP